MSAIPVFDSSVTNTVELARSRSVRLHGIEVTNPNTSDVYIQLFDAAAAADVTLGTTPPVLPLMVPAGSSSTMCGVRAEQYAEPLLFNAGLCYAATTTNTGLTAPGTAVPVTLFLRSGK